MRRGSLSFSKRWFHIERQLWSDSPLIRSNPLMEHDTGEKERHWLKEAATNPTSRFCIWHRGKLAVSVSNQAAQQLTWTEPDFLQQLANSTPSIVPYEFNPLTANIDTTLLLLGKVKDDHDLSLVDVKDSNLLESNTWRFALDLSAMEEEVLLELLKNHSTTSSSRLVAPRALMGSMTHDPGSMAVAGMTAARMAWHNEIKYCRRSGNRTVPTGGGHRRLDPLESNHRLGISYPRTDPVAIMLVENTTGDRCLLGRTARRKNTNMYTCLAGFIEQAESVEDAVRREVMEESGVVISNYEDVRLVGSQPWPIGSAGHSELMLGCIARASNDTITINKDEMDDIRWFTRKEATELLNRSKEENASGDATKDLIVPPPYAIAHHLIKAWVETTVPEDGEKVIPHVADVHDGGMNIVDKMNWNVVAISVGVGALFGAIMMKMSSL
jgi:NADH pyrophosphatase NudC (nudix superfamily)